MQQDIATARFVHTQNVGPTDSDNDGVTNTDELTLGTDPFNPDSDGDGIPDGTEVGANPASPTDTDNDGIPDVVESATADRDGDGIPNQADADSDNDGIPDGVEAGPGPGQRDTDGDGTPDYLDRDSDNDGIPDAREAGAEPAVPADTDGDGIPNYRDLDSDADGLPDRLEGGVTGVDTDGDGIDNAFDVNTLGGTDLNNDGVDDSVFPVSTDPDGVPDYLDTDSDNDGILDTREGNVTGTDTDSDGIDDALDVNLTGGPDANGDGIDVSVRTRRRDARLLRRHLCAEQNAVWSHRPRDDGQSNERWGRPHSLSRPPMSTSSTLRTCSFWSRLKSLSGIPGNPVFFPVNFTVSVPFSSRGSSSNAWARCLPSSILKTSFARTA